MGRKEKSKSSSVFTLLIAAGAVLVTVLDVGSVGYLILFVVAGLVGFLIWGVIKALSSQQSGYGVNPHGGSAQPFGDRSGEGDMARPGAGPFQVKSYRPEQPRSAAVKTHEDNLRRMEELDDLLKAGIVEQAEYLDRMAELKTEGR
ncbi:MAG TPA: hypothetical protein VN626_01800 [Clostridia bacterium]|nr:hypothetical protein [Clostridia bacterium]